ncbi:uncharacterized protein LOC110466714 [Mizuhopecten yessoensis]|uniref:G-rich sequence factor 1 n=1 Tax=Mizuhopecten yessoensis TaxID=6573 RepID=A0A210PNI3_MIZYE|nr:uncharacterized protein LOC110466714 [Mizuhopecten yessoensis]OWF38070.1 G-rich sequence factor 1 [Mizuhopecten yessoensis]
MSLCKIIRGLSVSLPRCRLLLQSQNVSRIARTSVGFQQTAFEPHILPAASFCTTNTERESVFMTLLGVPWRSSEKDIVDFLKGIHVQDVIFEYKGYHQTGRVYVEVSESDVSDVLAKDKEYIGTRYINVTEANESDRSVISNLQEELKKKPKTNTESVYVQLLGVPYNVTKEEIRDFLTGCQVEEILFDYDDSRKNGIVYVRVPNDDVQTAVAKDREYIGARYVKVLVNDSERTRHLIPRLQGIEKKMQFLKFDLEKSDMTYISLHGALHSSGREEIGNFLEVPIEEMLFREVAGDAQGMKYNNIYCLINKKDLGEALKKDGTYEGNRYIKVQKTPDHAMQHLAFAKTM